MFDIAVHSGALGSREHKSLKHDLDRLWFLQYYPALQYYQWLMDIGQHPERYPEVTETYLGHMMPKLGEWATAGGVWNKAAVARKATENLIPFYFGLGQQGAAGIIGGWTPPPGYELDLMKLSRQMGVVEQSWGQGMGMGMSMGMGGFGGGGGTGGALGQGAAQQVRPGYFGRRMNWWGT